FRRLQPHAAAIAAVAAVRPAQRDELLPAESHAAVAAVAGGDGDFGFVNELHGVKAGNRESGIGNRESGIGNRESGIGNRESLSLCRHSRESGNPATSRSTVMPYRAQAASRHWVPAFAGMTTRVVQRLPRTVDRNKRPRQGGAFVPRTGRRQPATTLTVRRFFGPLVANSTLPSTSANRVWSRPRPTPGPGWNWVPRWRTMMLPASMAWPP